ncbi:hypothetical protein M9Y10_002375 [Tritrichomonas musculus]|uniref:Spindle assembly abnormal protein 6 N-terminal domain-containing protein n=1 Tax=Tritrichomonas musculus TaxID=1915356 RepID=A0ABR2L9N6_9EUKA
MAFNQDNIDPSLRNTGYEIIFCKTINLEFRVYKDTSDSNESGTKAVWVRVLTKKGDNNKMIQVKFEVMDDADLFTIYESVFNEQSFNEMKAEDQLLIDFQDFPNNVTELLNESESSDSQTQITFVQEDDQSMTMEFLQILELKAVEIFKLKFIPSNEVFIQDQVQFRYNKIKEMLKYKKEFLTEFDRQVQSKNPILAKSLKSPRHPRK